MIRLPLAVPAVLVLASCGSKLPCDVDALRAGLNGAATPDASRDVVAATCKLPEPLAAWTTGDDQVPAGVDEVWATVCPSGAPPTHPGRIADRLSVYEACDLGRLQLAESEAFALATGRPVLGAALQVWLISKEMDEALARQVATAVMGPVVANPGLALGQLPRVSRGSDPVEPMVRIDGEALWQGQAKVADVSKGRVDAPPDDRWAGWGVRGVEAGPAVTAAGDTSMQAFRRVAASLAGPGEVVQLNAVRSQDEADSDLVAFPVHMPNGKPLVRVKKAGAAWHVVDSSGKSLAKNVAFDAARAAVPENARVALDLPDDATLQDWLVHAAQLKGDVALAMDQAPCHEPVSGTACVAGDVAKGTPSFYLDVQDVSVADYARCVDAGFCPAAGNDKGAVSGLKWEGAWRYCAWTGKRLPTVEELERAGVTGKLWSGAARAPSGAVAKNTWRASPAHLRCATSQSFLSTFPPRLLTQPYPERALPEPPTDEQRAIAANIKEDDLQVKPVCSEDQLPAWTPKGMKGGVSTNFCRDPISYVTSNEKRRHVWGKYLANIGGAYTGVGADQAYDFIAAARSEWAWPFDYDPNVVRVHKVDQALILHSETRQDFVNRFAPGAVEESLELIERVHGERADEYKAFYSVYRARLHKHYTKSLDPSWKDEAPDFGWLANDANYQWIRTGYQQGRIVPVGGDLMGPGSVQSISKAVKALGVPLRVYYPSNAPLAWGGLMYPGYKANIAALPFEDESIVIASYNTGAYGQNSYWHYNIQHAKQYQARLALDETTHVKHVWWDRIPADDGSVTVNGLPAD